MDDGLTDIKERVAAVRRALDEYRRRLAAVRERAESAGASGAVPGPAGPLFPSPGGLDDELHFEALDTEDPGREER
jgi:hypothetical protein